MSGDIATCEKMYCFYCEKHHEEDRAVTSEIALVFHCDQ